MSGKKHGDKRKIDAISEVDEKPKIKREDRIPMVDDKTKMKRSSRNASEKRRRDKLNTYINELSAMVPSCSSPHSSRKLDKSTILKLTVSYMRLHADLLSPSPNESTVSWKPAFLSNEELGTLMLEALDGFLFVITMSGRILFVSHTVAPLLGHLQNYLIGRSLFDITHDEDRECLDSTLKQHFTPQVSESSSSSGSKGKVNFTIRMARGGSNPNSFELVHCSGHVRRWEDAIKNPSQDGEFTDIGGQGLMLDAETSPTHCLVAVGKMEAPRIIRDMSSIELGKNEYISRHSLEAKYLFVDGKGPSIIGYLPSEIIGSSAYDFYHIDDLSLLSVNHKNLMNHGNSVTMFYRFLTKGQQWIWLQTHGYVEYNKWTKKPETIICHNVVVSYSKVLEYLQTRALEYGPNMPPVDPARSPTDIIIGALCPDGRKPPALLGEDKISEVTPGGARITEVTPGISKEEPPSPPVGLTVLNCPVSIQANPYTPQPAQRNEVDQYNNMDVDSTMLLDQHHPELCQEPHQILTRQPSPGHLQHIDMQRTQDIERTQELQRNQMLNMHPATPQQQQPTQHVLSPPSQHPQQHQLQHSNHSSQHIASHNKHNNQHQHGSHGNQQHVAIPQQQQPNTQHQSEPQPRIVQIAQHVNMAPQTPHLHIEQPRQSPQINIPPQTPHNHSNQQIIIQQPMSNQSVQPQQQHVQHIQQPMQHAQQQVQQQVQQQQQHVQQPSPLPQQPIQQHVQQQQSHVQQQPPHSQQQPPHAQQQPQQLVQQPIQQHVQQQAQHIQGQAHVHQPQHVQQLAQQHVQQQPAHAQQQQPQHVQHQPVQHQPVQHQPVQHQPVQPQHVQHQPVTSQYSMNSQPPTPQQHSVQQHTEPQQRPALRQHQQRPPPQTIQQQPAHNIQQHLSQLRPQINLQGIQYMTRPASAIISPTLPPNVVHKPDTQHGQRICSPQQQSTNCQQRNSQTCQQPQQGGTVHEAPQYATQLSPQFVIPTADGSANVIVIQQPGSDQYQFAQLYPIIHSMSGQHPSSEEQKQAHTNGGGVYEVAKNNSYYQNAQTVIQAPVKQETTRCARSAPSVQPYQDKAILRNINHIFDQSDHGSSDHVLDTIDPEYISMILSNTNIDNIMDTQWNNMLFDPPPKASIVSDTSSNPSPISSHSPGT